jgi:hypothetical protein
VKKLTKTMLATECRLCHQLRSEHPGSWNDGKCPDSKWGDGRRFAPVRKVATGRRRNRKQSPLPGYGPWRILADCPSPTHNSARASEAREGSIRCVCPRALALKEGRIKAWSEGWHEKTGGQRVHKVTHAPKVSMGNMSMAACRTKSNRDIVDAAFDGQAGYSPMKKICDGCPIVEGCRAYVSAAESPAGSWGGVWGGMTPRERLTAFG